MKQRRLLPGLALAIILTLPAGALPAADYNAALDAWYRGDIPAAHRDFLELAKAGSPDAQYSLAMLYLKRQPSDYGAAVPWLEKSAGNGLPDAQYMLGMLSLYGVGTAKDTKAGMRWLTLARDQGNRDAAALLARLEQERLEQAAAERRKAEQARNMRAELARAKAAEKTLEGRLAASRKREKALAAQGQSLKVARANEAEAVAVLRRERAKMTRELEELRALLAEAERLQAEREAVPAVAAAEAPTPAAPSAAGLAPGQSVVSGRVSEILPEGVLLTDVSQRIKDRDEPFPEGFVVYVDVPSTDGLAEGQRVAWTAEPATPYRYKLESGATGRIRAFRVVGN